MATNYGQLGNQAKSLWSNLTPLRKVSLLITGLIVLAALLTLTFWAKQVDFQLLYSNLNQQDASSIVAKLREQKIPYELLSNGATIMVPSDQVYNLRLELAGQGLPQGGGVGFEIFDKQNFGMSDFQQKLNYQRALQGELARTISQFSEVEQTRVHIVLPEKSLFSEDKRDPSAAVVLKLKNGKRLGQSQIEAIVNLVAGSVEGLKAGRVNVADTNGEILHGGQGESEFKQLTNGQMDYQRTLEKNLEQRIESMLSKLTGPEKSLARVSAIIDFQQIEETHESYDPNSAVVRSEQRTTEKSSGGGLVPSGVPGVSSNMPSGIGANANPQNSNNSKYQKQNETVNYEINKSIRRIVQPTGKIKSLSVAVVVDGSYQESGGTAKYVPRSKEEMAQIENIVKKAIGFDSKRGDQVEVANVPFQSPVGGEEARMTPRAPLTEILFSLLKRSPLFIMAIIIVFFLVRPVLRWITVAKQPLQLPSSLPQTVQQLEQKLAGSSSMLQPPTSTVSATANAASRTFSGPLDKAKEIAKEDAALTAQLIKNWLKEE